MVKRLPELWSKADPNEKRRLLLTVLDVVCVDSRGSAAAVMMRPKAARLVRSSPSPRSLLSQSNVRNFTPADLMLEGAPKGEPLIAVQFVPSLRLGEVAPKGNHFGLVELTAES